MTHVAGRNCLVVHFHAGLFACELSEVGRTQHFLNYLRRRECTEKMLIKRRQ